MDDFFEEMHQLVISTRTSPGIKLENIREDELQLDTKKIGSGKNSEVFFGKYSDRAIALKKFKESNINPEFEGIMHLRAQHDYVVKLYGCVRGPQYNGLVMEQCTEGDLFDFLKLTKLVNTMPERECYIFQIAQALAYLHDNCGIIHADIKPDNILLTTVNDKKMAKISDFGYSIVLGINQKQQSVSKAAGTAQYAAPELIAPAGGPFLTSFATDMFAFGIVLKQMVTDDPFSALYFSHRLGEILRFHAEGGHEHRLPADNTYTTEKMHTMITSLLLTNLYNRMPAREIVSALKSETFVFKSTVKRLD